MLQTTEASKGLLFGSFLYRSDLYPADLFQDLWEQHYGSSFSCVPEVNPLNNYYEKEMGSPLSRVFFLSTMQSPRDLLLESKLKAIEWEHQWSSEGKRSVNIDTGFLSLENFLLATTKNYSHRVYIGQNLFADLTYFFQNGEIHSFPWTYPDYLDPQKKKFLLWGRSFLHGQKNR